MRHFRSSTMSSAWTFLNSRSVAASSLASFRRSSFKAETASFAFCPPACLRTNLARARSFMIDSFSATSDSSFFAANALVSSSSMMSSLTCWSSFLHTNWCFDFHAKPAALKWGGVRGSRWLLTAILATFLTTSGSSGSPSPLKRSQNSSTSSSPTSSCASLNSPTFISAQADANGSSLGSAGSSPSMFTPTSNRAAARGASSGSPSRSSKSIARSYVSSNLASMTFSGCHLRQHCALTTLSGSAATGGTSSLMPGTWSPSLISLSLSLR
ncbi:unnamed protein product [Pelagomonas calceolata]|uniref:Uncharacterized protein n=1 Tax=Pelagomonas calceolata TaxID=35677 RepID=A0A8J2X0G9_9STRA|nr:unnamed protein product [Pelagomonas calceolata]|mmetsp:Transcript_2529/g.7269  ORF Transcript_2529/g.7269 Transcript_2529/m.7269 type:complete len:270 (-) Transcript_2529:6020-6829(-)